MKTVSWAYLRNGCSSCCKAREVLERSGAEIEEKVDARKHPLAGEQLEALIDSVKSVSVASGGKVFRYCPGQADRSELMAKVIGRTGNLRAPALRLGEELLIGYNDALYSRFG